MTALVDVRVSVEVSASVVASEESVVVGKGVVVIIDVLVDVVDVFVMNFVEVVLVLLVGLVVVGASKLIYMLPEKKNVYVCFRAVLLIYIRKQLMFMQKYFITVYTIYFLM